ncbi:hypothetical protein EVAR_79671_1 [Eumeta japonica]|uniref:Uncharacterized protein n=1 Tax=Eumeta variegata TaxID=151549 RepID=A0A4C1WBG2_EUMVA|nr:hypothetical protein EVAR_79671_1 [Eumeta japonica]
MNVSRSPGLRVVPSKRIAHLAKVPDAYAYMLRFSGSLERERDAATSESESIFLGLPPVAVNVVLMRQSVCFRMYSRKRCEHGRDLSFAHYESWLRSTPLGSSSTDVSVWGVTTVAVVNGSGW